MSRIGKLPITIPENVKVSILDGILKVEGPKGALQRNIPKEISLKLSEGKIWVLAKEKTKQSRALHGTTRALIANMVWGVSQGFSKTLELVGTGYRAEVSGNTLILSIGYSHPVRVEAPEGVNFRVEKSEIIIEGVEKEVVTQLAAKIRAIRPPEPYKGKGILYKNEKVRRKAGKAAKAIGVSG